jgi:hypothetical protein
MRHWQLILLVEGRCAKLSELEASHCGMHYLLVGLEQALARMWRRTTKPNNSWPGPVRFSGLVDARAAFSHLVTMAQHRKFQLITV